MAIALISLVPRPRPIMAMAGKTADATHRWSALFFGEINSSSLSASRLKLTSMLPVQRARQNSSSIPRNVPSRKHSPCHCPCRNDPAAPPKLAAVTATAIKNMSYSRNLGSAACLTLRRASACQRIALDADPEPRCRLTSRQPAVDHRHAHEDQPIATWSCMSASLTSMHRGSHRGALGNPQRVSQLGRCSSRYIEAACTACPTRLRTAR